MHVSLFSRYTYIHIHTHTGMLKTPKCSIVFSAEFFIPGKFSSADIHTYTHTYTHTHIHIQVCQRRRHATRFLSRIFQSWKIFLSRYTYINTCRSNKDAEMQHRFLSRIFHYWKTARMRRFAAEKNAERVDYRLGEYAVSVCMYVCMFVCIYEKNAERGDYRLGEYAVSVCMYVCLYVYTKGMPREGTIGLESML